MTQRKERSDSLANQLSDEQYDKLREWLTMPGGTIAAALEKLAEVYGIESSTGALHNFYHKHCVKFKMRKARDLASEVKAVLAESDESFDDATLALAEQRAFELAVENDGDVGDLVSLQKLKIERIKLQLQREKIEQDNRKITLLEEKAARLDKVNDVVKDAKNRGISKETLQEIEEAIGLL